MNASLSQLGDIKQSLLSTVKFQSIHGDCWVKMEGQNITGSDLANLEPSLSTLPNSTGRFLRDIGGNAEPLAQVQGDAIRNITGSIGQVSHGTTGVNVQTGALTYTNNGTGNAGGGGTSHTLHFNASLVVPTADENRPINLSVNMFIKINNDCNFN